MDFSKVVNFIKGIIRDNGKKVIDDYWEKGKKKINDIKDFTPLDKEYFDGMFKDKDKKSK